MWNKLNDIIFAKNKEQKQKDTDVQDFIMITIILSHSHIYNLEKCSVSFNFTLVMLYKDCIKWCSKRSSNLYYSHFWYKISNKL